MKVYLYNVTTNDYRECASLTIASRWVWMFMNGAKRRHEICLRLSKAHKEGYPFIFHYDNDTLICFFKKTDLEKLLKELNIEKEA